ncbi:siderophore-interacting protein [Streptomyces sp. 7N604]|uniref:siderophore-interacting protein n=1 Tax=Streptomyces sp. 7N604 TaxID=3457415 RepID=UPI003FD533EF
MEQPLPVRLIQVTEVKRVTPRMARITFGGDDLADFGLDGPDQQVKLYFPKPGQAVPRLPEAGTDGDVMRWYEAFSAIPEDERPWMRSYTIRAHHPQHRTIDIDFVLHRDAGGGPATRWAGAAAAGDTLGMFGPSAMFARPIPLGTTDWLLLAGDEAALPAMSTLIEALPEGARAVAWIEVADAAEEQRFETAGELTVHWLHRGTDPAGQGHTHNQSLGHAHSQAHRHAHGQALVEAVRAAEFPSGSGSVFAWLAGEAGTVRALRRHMVNDRGIDKRSIDFTGYWRLKLTQDDAPTPDDLADARELLARARQ